MDRRPMKKNGIKKRIIMIAIAIVTCIAAYAVRSFGLLSKLDYGGITKVFVLFIVSGIVASVVVVVMHKDDMTDMFQRS